MSVTRVPALHGRQDDLAYFTQRLAAAGGGDSEARALCAPPPVQMNLDSRVPRWLTPDILTIADTFARFGQVLALPHMSVSEIIAVACLDTRQRHNSPQVVRPQRPDRHHCIARGCLGSVAHAHSHLARHVQSKAQKSKPCGDGSPHRPQPRFVPAPPVLPAARRCPTALAQADPLIGPPIGNAAATGTVGVTYEVA